MRIVWGLLVLVVVCVGAKLSATEARAADPPVVASFTEVGAKTFTVPAGVTSIHVVAVGAPGGGKEAQLGGHGATATADVAVTAGQVLGVFVGGPGLSGSETEKANPGGFNGGGNGGSVGLFGSMGSGGGASDIRASATGDLTARLVTAAGGGGAGRDTAGADAGQSAKPLNTFCTGGGAGTASAGGAGGTGDGDGTSFNSVGAPGAIGVGGSAGFAGGGGGGLFGGGGGGGTVREGHTGDPDTCGGGGGSSGFGPGTSATSVSVSGSTTPSVTISYLAPPAPPTVPGGPGTGTGKGAGGGSTGGFKANLSLPAVQHGKAVVGTVQIPANRSLLKAKLLWQKTKESKQLIFGNLTEGPLKKGLHSFTVKLNGNGKSKLAALGSLKLTLSVAVIPPQGAVAKAWKKVKLKP
jgi:hypothetical protein